MTVGIATSGYLGLSVPVGTVTFLGEPPLMQPGGGWVVMEITAYEETTVKELTHIVEDDCPEEPTLSDKNV